MTLPLKEFELLELLLANAGRVLTREMLIDRVWGADYVGDTKTLDVHVKRLRARSRPTPPTRRASSPSAASATSTRSPADRPDRAHVVSHPIWMRNDTECRSTRKEQAAADSLHVNRHDVSFDARIAATALCP